MNHEATTSLGAMRRAILIAVAMLAVQMVTEQTKADEAKAHLSALMSSAFKCATYANNAEKKEDAKRLFDTGYKAGQEFMAAVGSGQVSKDDLSKHVSVIVGLLLRSGGPSKEFVLGRMFEFISDDDYDDIVKKDASGMSLEMKDWVQDKERQKIKATTLYNRSNCDLIR
jgi:hypothetical protein